MNFPTVCYIFTTFTLKIRRETKFMALLQRQAHFHQIFHISTASQFSFDIYLNLNETHLHVRVAARRKFHCRNKRRKVLVDLSAKINSRFVHFSSNEIFVQPKIVKYNENSFYAPQITPFLSILSTVCNLIVFYQMRGKNGIELEQSGKTNNSTPFIKVSHTRTHTFPIIRSNFFSLTDM